jgi:hypothetical protein
MQESPLYLVCYSRIVDCEENMGDEEDFDHYTAFQMWDYRQLIYVGEHKKPWIIFRESFFRVSEIIVKNLAAGRGFEDIEGPAAVFLFRHYLELALKALVMRGRFLERLDKNAALDSERGKTYSQPRGAGNSCWLMRSPKSIPGDWGNYDIGFIEKCIAEFVSFLTYWNHVRSDNMNTSQQAGSLFGCFDETTVMGLRIPITNCFHSGSSVGNRSITGLGKGCASLGKNRQKCR